MRIRWYRLPIFWNLLQLWQNLRKHRGTQEGVVYWPVSNVAWPHYLTSNVYDKQNKTLEGGAFRCFTAACLWEEGRCENPTSTQNRRLKALFHLELIRKQLNSGISSRLTWKQSAKLILMRKGTVNTKACSHSKLYFTRTWQSIRHLFNKNQMKLLFPEPRV